MIDKTDALGKTSLFSGLHKQALDAIADRSIVRRLKRDEVLFFAGEEASGLYIIVKGAVRAFRTSADGREQIIHVETAPASFAEVPVFDKGIYPSTVAAEQDSILLFIGKSDINQLCLVHPQIALAAVRLLAGRLRKCAELVETLSLRDVGQRLARFLLATARSHGTRTPSGFVLELGLTNQQIAARLGTVREVISRSFTRLQADGFIWLNQRQITITDEDSLSLYADG